MAKLKVTKLTPKKGYFPDLLSAIPDSPKQLYWIGADPEELLSRPTLAVVGSRKVTPYGNSITAKITGDLARQGIVIVSGLALGVDSLAHEAALRAGGVTIAVLPCGLDRIYPASHHGLAKEILKRGGALVTEYDEGVDILNINFIARNRIISGLSLGVLITEAAEKSGTLHTANFALEQGREVLAVPGNITSQNSIGTNNLIKTGATPVTDAHDVLNALGLKLEPQTNREVFGDTKEETVILQLIADGVCEGEALLKESRLNPNIYNQTLSMLEVTGKIKPEGAGRWTIV